MHLQSGMASTRRSTRLGKGAVQATTPIGVVRSATPVDEKSVLLTVSNASDFPPEGQSPSTSQVVGTPGHMPSLMVSPGPAVIKPENVPVTPVAKSESSTPSVSVTPFQNIK